MSPPGAEHGLTRLSTHWGKAGGGGVCVWGVFVPQNLSVVNTRAQTFLLAAIGRLPVSFQSPFLTYFWLWELRGLPSQTHAGQDRCPPPSLRGIPNPIDPIRSDIPDPTHPCIPPQMGTELPSAGGVGGGFRGCNPPGGRG